MLFWDKCVVMERERGIRALKNATDATDGVSLFKAQRGLERSEAHRFAV